MTDKEKIRLQTIKLIDGLNKSCTPNPNGSIMECMVAAEIEALKLVVDYIDSLSLEPLNEDMESAARDYAESVDYRLFSQAPWNFVQDCYKAGVVATQEQLLKGAKSGVVKDNYVEFDDGTCIDLDPSMRINPAFPVETGDKVKVLVVKSE